MNTIDSWRRIANRTGPDARPDIRVRRSDLKDLIDAMDAEIATLKWTHHLALLPLADDTESEQA